MSVEPSAEADSLPGAASSGRQGINNTDMAALADQIDQLGAALAAMQRQFLSLSTRIRAMAAADGRTEEVVTQTQQSAQPVGLTVHNGDKSEPVAPEMSHYDAEPIVAPICDQDAIGTVEAFTSPSLVEDPAAAARVDQLEEILQSYRELIAQPVKNEINRWLTQAGGLSCEVADDDHFYLPGGDAKGLLALIPLTGETAIVLPAGRLVVDFTSNFANVIAMRPITRRAFDLIGGDGGKLQLIEPAYASLAGGKWRLDRPGKVGGFSSN